MKHRKIIVALVLSLLLLNAAMPIQAASSATALPPLPEWPIIGPILQWLGIVEPIPVEIVELPEDLNLPQYSIETLDDIRALQDLTSGERVRVTATDTALTAIVREAIGNVNGIENPTLTFAPGKATAYVEVDGSILEDIDFDLPINLKGSIKLEAAVELSASGCRATVIVEKVSINNWSLGLKGIAQRWVNDQLPGLWPSEYCLERVTVKSGEIAVVGYRR
jgi:hypothetical protein